MHEHALPGVVSVQTTPFLNSSVKYSVVGRINLLTLLIRGLGRASELHGTFKFPTQAIFPE